MEQTDGRTGCSWFTPPYRKEGHNKKSYFAGLMQPHQHAAPITGSIVNRPLHLLNSALHISETMQRRRNYRQERTKYDVKMCCLQTAQLPHFVVLQLDENLKFRNAPKRTVKKPT